MTVKKKTRLTSYNFWVRIVSAVVLILRIILSKFGINIDSAFILDIATLVAGFLVVVGIINEPTGITISYKNESGDDMANTENIKTKIDEKLKEVEKIFAGFGIKDKAVVAESLQKIDDFLVTILQNELKDIEKMQNELDGKTDEAENELDGKTDEAENEEGENEKTEYENKEILETENVQSEECRVDSKNECVEAVTENVGTEEIESTKTENENTKAEEHESVEAESNKDQIRVAENGTIGEVEETECGVAENKINDEVEETENDEFKEAEVRDSETETSGEMGKTEVEASENEINEKLECESAEVEEAESENAEADTAQLETIEIKNNEPERGVAESKVNVEANETESEASGETDEAERGVAESKMNDEVEETDNEIIENEETDADQSQQSLDADFVDPQDAKQSENSQSAIVSQSEDSQSAIELIKNLQDEFCGDDQTKRGEFCDRLLSILENNLDSLV